LVDPVLLERFSAADYAQHIQGLRGRAPLDFNIIFQRPFVIVGDESEAVLRQRATQIVQWAVDRLRADFFAKDPENIVDIWLFRDKSSYDKNTWEVFHEHPTTPYGYYSRAEKSLIMNIETGGGTLVHEMVHPFIQANFPKCPPWFDEGLGSLFEQSADRDGHIIGLPNWRLPALKDAIREHSLPSFQTLMAMTSDQFYGSNVAMHYAQSRYLCYYLQEKGRLISFYKTFSSKVAQDPTGIRTLQEVLGNSDLSAIQKDWESFVLKLTYP
jgi:hypothetical protein